MSEWKTQLLSDVAQVIDSLHKTPTYFDSGIPMVRVTDIQGGYLDLRNTFKVDEQTYNEFARKHQPQHGDLVFSRVGTYGSVSFVNDSTLFCLGQNTVFIVPEINPYFLFYFLNSPFARYQIDSFATGSTQKTISLASINSIVVSSPPAKEQDSIANLLSCLDRKISNLRQQNETLESIAQTLFKHWFVDFEFPNEDGKPYKSSGGAMVRSDLGDIPVGWEVGKLGDFCNIKHGYAFTGEFITTEETAQILLTPGNFRIGGGFNSSKYKYYSDDDYNKEYILESGDLIVNMTDLSKEGDSLGYPAFVPKSSTYSFLHNQRLGKVINSKINLFYLFYLLCRREYRSHILGTASGSTVRHTSPSRILEHKFPVPGQEILDKFSLITRSLIEKISSHDEQIQTLTQTRDRLLPKLMSGQLRIPE